MTVVGRRLSCRCRTSSRALFTARRWLAKGRRRTDEPVGAFPMSMQRVGSAVRSGDADGRRSRSMRSPRLSGDEQVDEGNGGGGAVRRLVGDPKVDPQGAMVMTDLAGAARAG